MTNENDLKRLMEVKSGSVKAFSEDIGLAYTTVRSILERGIFNAKVDNVIKICKGLNINPEELMGWKEDKREQVDNVAAHIDGDYTEEELRQIREYAALVRKARSKE